MDKRYQVFISSTFQDLEGARQEVSQALLRADCFPAGMELFPAADEEQFEFIKQVIDQSDYYIVISAGRYGSIHPEKGISYTELEYDYAISVGKPVIRLLHKDPFNKLRGELIEETDEGRKKLRAFREKLSKSRMARFWEDPRELGAEVVYGIMDARKRKPATGWVRADGRATPEAERKIAELRQQVAELELEIERTKSAGVNFNTLISEMRENVSICIVVHERNSYGERSEIDRTNAEIELGDLCVEICIAALERFTEGQIESYLDRSIPKKLDAKADEDTTVEFSDKNTLKRILHRLENLGFLKSTANQTSGNIRMNYQAWELTDDARRWVSGVAACL